MRAYTNLHILRGTFCLTKNSSLRFWKFCVANKTTFYRISVCPNVWKCLISNSCFILFSSNFSVEWSSCCQIPSLSILVTMVKFRFLCSYYFSSLLRYMLVEVLRESACDCMHEIITKGMEPVAKQELVESLLSVLEKSGVLQLQEVCVQYLVAITSVIHIRT